MIRLPASLRTVAASLVCLLLPGGLLLCAPAGPLVPDTGTVAVRMRAQELTSGLRVLVLSLRPGDEDLTTLAHLRFGLGAHVVSAYITNGESGEHDTTGMLPRDFAAVRRNGTAAALERLEIDSRFLNFADPGSTADSADVRQVWRKDSLKTTLEGVISALKPGMIVVSRDWEGGPGSVLSQEVFSILRDVTVPPSIRKTPGSGVVGREKARWTSARIWADQGSGAGVKMPGAGVSPVLGRTYGEIAGELEANYAWHQVQRRSRQPGVAYSLILPAGKRQVKRLEEGIDPGIPGSLRRLHTILGSYAKDVQRGRLPRKELLRRMVRVMDSVDTAIGSTPDRTSVEMRILIDWKGILENLRNALLGVTVTYTLSEDILTELQLTYLTIESVTGRGDGGSTEVYFPSTERGWILNESGRSRIPLELPGQYRLVSPKSVVYDLPHAEYVMEHPVTVRPVMFFLLHKGRSREENFVYRISLPIRYGPRLMAEVLTPIVRCTPGEFLVTRMTNNTRDGLRDSLSVADSIVHSGKTLLQLSTKGASAVDTLQLTWRDTLPDGTFLAPVDLGGIEVSRFAARKFDVRVDTSLTVCLLTSMAGSPAADALRRLGLPRVHVLRSAAECRAMTATPDVVIVDRRYLSLASDGTRARPALEEVVRRGGHVIILAQDAEAWNAFPLWDALRLQRDHSIAPRVPAFIDTTHELLRAPNVIGQAAFQEWLFASGYNSITVAGSGLVETPIRYDTKRPLLLTSQTGGGRMTYADLALGPQWLSIHPGAFRIFANLLSVRTSRHAPH